MLGNYRMAAQLVASRAVLSSTELVSKLDFEERNHQEDIGVDGRIL
jgi:hypothetical protein